MFPVRAANRAVLPVLWRRPILGWSADQAARLRRVAAGEALPDGAGVDWANVVEEIEGVGRFSRYTVLTEFRTAVRLVLMAHR